MHTESLEENMIYYEGLNKNRVYNNVYKKELHNQINDAAPIPKISSFFCPRGHIH